MKSEFYEIYYGLYADYIYMFDYPLLRRELFIPFESETNILREIRRAIEKAEMEFEKQDKFQNLVLRPDAKFFLLTNFHLMIVKPLLEHKEKLWNQTRSQELYYETINKDIRLIIGEAYSLTRNKGKKIVSGHSIMSAIDLTWRVLKSTSFEFWGDDED